MPQCLGSPEQYKGRKDITIIRSSSFMLVYNVKLRFNTTIFPVNFSFLKKIFLVGKELRGLLPELISLALYWKEIWPSKIV